jgi:hypothetical protein
MEDERFDIGDGGGDLQIWKVPANMLNKQSRTTDKGWPTSLGVGCGLRSPHRKNNVTKYYKEIIKTNKMRTAGHVARMGTKRNVKYFGGKSRRKEPTMKI